MRSLSCCRLGVALSAALFAGCRIADLVRPPTGSPLSVTFTAQPSSAESGNPITPPVEVTVFDAEGHPDTVRRAVQIALASNPTGAALSGTTEVATVAGVARFADLRIDQPGEGYVLRAAVQDGRTVASTSFDVVRPPPAQLMFTVQPNGGRANQPMTPAIEVTALEGDGDQVPWFNGAITLTLAPNTLGAAATGTLTVNAAAGVARFANVRVDRVGVDLRLMAAFAGAAPSRTSDAFAVTP